MNNFDRVSGYQDEEMAATKEKELAQLLSFLNSLEQGWDRVDEKYKNRIPDNYAEIQGRLIQKEWRTDDHERITLFHGGSMRWNNWGINDGWLQPIDYVRRDEKGHDFGLILHLLTMNCDLGRNYRGQEAELNLSSEIDNKLVSFEDESVNLKKTILRTKDKSRVVLRPSLNGSIAFPLVHTSADYDSDDPQTLENFTKAITRVVNDLDLRIDLSQLQARLQANIMPEIFQPQREIGNFMVGKEKEILANSGMFYVTEVIQPQNAWKKYELITAQPWDKIDVDQPQLIRIDSACDMGMSYMDQGCDCHWQLLTALRQIRLEKSGIIVHVPTQDGRGFGANTKCQTEGMKWGIDVVTKKPIPSVNTNLAAKTLLGENTYDCRSYGAVGELLNALGLSKVKVYTDNIKKIWALQRKLGITKVEQEYTNTIEAMIARQEDPMVIWQMLSKLVEDKKYVDAIGDETLDDFLRYIQIRAPLNASREEKLALIDKYVNASV
jgi:GTP cyclohydrolase II